MCVLSRDSNNAAEKKKANEGYRECGVLGCGVLVHTGRSERAFQAGWCLSRRVEDLRD